MTSNNLVVSVYPATCVVPLASQATSAGTQLRLDCPHNLSLDKDVEADTVAEVGKGALGHTHGNLSGICCPGCTRRSNRSSNSVVVAHSVVVADETVMAQVERG